MMTRNTFVNILYQHGCGIFSVQRCYFLTPLNSFTSSISSSRPIFLTSSFLFTTHFTSFLFLFPYCIFSCSPLYYIYRLPPEPSTKESRIFIMDKELIYQALVDIQNVCLASKDNILIAIQALDLLISTENGYSIYSHEFANYLKNHHFIEFGLTLKRKYFFIDLTNDELNSVLPEIIQRLGTRLEPMKTLSDPHELRYKIFLA